MTSEIAGEISPINSTVYVSNLSYTLTNNDLYQIFDKYGKIVKVTILRDKDRRSTGVAFIHYLQPVDADRCTAAVNNSKMFGRKLKASIAKDNGRSAEYMMRKDYPDKSKCYECGATGHLSYKCPINTLGEREPPKPKKRKQKSFAEDDEYSDADDAQQFIISSNETGNCSTNQSSGAKRVKYKKNSYLSDDEEICDDD